MIVLDASVLIAHFDEDDANHSPAVECLIRLAEHPLACSPITLSEVLVGPARRSQLDRAQRALSDLGVRETPLPGDAAIRLAMLRAQTGLKLPDCCVLLAAQEEDAAIVLTVDDKLARVAGELGFGSGDPRTSA